jgi:hypothetical protein
MRRVSRATIRGRRKVGGDLAGVEESQLFLDDL